MNTVEGLYINGVLVPVVNGILDRSETSILSKDIVTGYETLETVHELRLKGFGIVKIPPIVRCTGLKVLQLGTTSIAKIENLIVAVENSNRSQFFIPSLFSPIPLPPAPVTGLENMDLIHVVEPVDGIEGSRQVGRLGEIRGHDAFWSG